jgi:hypothetical protein
VWTGNISEGIAFTSNLIDKENVIQQSGRSGLLAIMALIGFSSYCILKLLFSRVTVLPPRVTVLLEPSVCSNLQSA